LIRYSLPPRLLMLLTFSYCSLPHLLLHSFPTRRSSDLSPSASAPCATPSPGATTSWTTSSDGSSPGCRSSWVGGRWSRPNPFPRSEEHTSELQSRVDLVCRLLLEKKKKE